MASPSRTAPTAWATTATTGCATRWSTPARPSRAERRPGLLQVPARARQGDHRRIGKPIDLRRHAGRLEHQRERPVAALGVGSRERRDADDTNLLASLAALHERAYALQELEARHRLALGRRIRFCKGKEVMVDGGAGCSPPAAASVRW